MKKLFVLFSILCASGYVAFCQSSVGLIAHWDMNGGYSDVSGNGHDGHGTAVTPAAGRFGVPNTAYSFNGTSSVITAPYMPDWNFSQYSICAVLKVNGFYGGLCEANFIVGRKDSYGVGGWGLTFDDNAFNTCGTLDVTKEVFIARAGSNAPSVPSAWQYTPTISTGNWYRVVMTYASTGVWKLYVNGSLINTITGSGSAAIGTSTDSVAIGKNIWNAAYPYYLNGVVDDIRIYNRVLNDTEIVFYGDTCGVVTAQPTNVMTAVGTTVNYSVSTSITTPTYQWQRNTGSGFTNLSNTAPFSGVTTPTLTITGVTMPLSSNNYRCLISNNLGCFDTSNAALLTVSTGISLLNQDGDVVLFPNPASQSITIGLPATTTEASIQLLDCTGRELQATTAIGGNSQLTLSGIPAGNYMVRIILGDKVVYKRFEKK